MKNEPCLCGDPECPRCFPSTYLRNRSTRAYEKYLEETEDPLFYKEWEKAMRELEVDKTIFKF